MEKTFTAKYKNGKIKEIRAKNKVLANAIARLYVSSWGEFEFV